MNTKKTLLILCVITVLAALPAGYAGLAAEYTNPAVMGRLELVPDDSAASPLPSPPVGDEPADTEGAYFNPGAVIAVVLAILLIVALVVIRLWKRRTPGKSGQDIP